MEGATTTAIDTIIEAASKVVDFSGTCLTTMVSNPVYAFILASGFIGIGLALVRKLVNTARF